MLSFSKHPKLLNERYPLVIDKKKSSKLSNFNENIIFKSRILSFEDKIRKDV